MNASFKARVPLSIGPMLLAFALSAKAATPSIDPAPRAADRAANRARSSHGSRELSLREICSSIQLALQSQGAPASALPAAEQIRPAVPIAVTVANPGLEVLRMDADVAPGAVRARLWTSGEPAIHPFDVRILADPALLHWLAQHSDSQRASLAFGTASDSARHAPASQPRAPQQPAPKPPTLVFPGQAATLLLEQPNMEVRTTVMPLARGVSGQWIRVRNLATGQIFAAEVVGPGSLAREF